MIFTDSASIKQVQSAINAAGYQPALVVDGVTGPKTTAGVRWFQQQHGLSADGLIGPQTMAATVAPTPAQAVAAVANPLAALQSQITQLTTAAPAVPAATPAPLVPTPVVAMPFTTSSLLPTLPRPATPSAYHSPVASSPLSGNVAGIPIPALIGAAVGAAGGMFLGLLWAAAGLVGGGAAGYAYATLGPGASMHGEEDGPEFCSFDADYGCDEPMITAGEIGVETSVGQLKA